MHWPNPLYGGTLPAGGFEQAGRAGGVGRAAQGDVLYRRTDQRHSADTVASCVDPDGTTFDQLSPEVANGLPFFSSVISSPDKPYTRNH